MSELLKSILKESSAYIYNGSRRVESSDPIPSATQSNVTMVVGLPCTVKNVNPKEVQALFAETLGVPANRVDVLAGYDGPGTINIKLDQIPHAQHQQILERLGPLLKGPVAIVSYPTDDEAAEGVARLRANCSVSSIHPSGVRHSVVASTGSATQSM